MGNTLSDLGLRYAMLKELKEHHEKMATLLGSEIAAMGAALYREFADNQQASFRLLGERAFKDQRDRIISPVAKYKATIISQPVFYEMLRKSGQGSLIKETIHEATLSKWVTEHKQKNLALPEESILKIWTVESCKVIRAPRSANEKAEKQEGETE